MAIERPRMLLPVSHSGQGDPSTISVLALQVVLNPRIQLARHHVSRVPDRANPRSNTVHQLFEMAANRSAYEHAPGGSIQLDVRVLRGLIELARHYTFAVSELAGGSHSRGSLHYRGTAFDINVINGRPVSLNHPDYRGFMADCQALGAAKVIGPPSPGHSSHVHAEWH